MPLPAFLAIISAVAAANQDGGGQQPITQAQGYSGMNDQQPSQQQPSLGTLQGIQQPAGAQQQQPRGGGNVMNTIGNIAGVVNSLQNSGQQQGLYQMPYLRRR